MTDYCHIDDGAIDDGPRALPRAWRNVSGLRRGTPEFLKDKGWLPVRYVDESFDPATQVRTGPVGCNVGDPVPPDADEVVGIYTVKDKTQLELDDDQQAVDIAKLSTSVDKIAFILTELTQKLFEKNVIIPDDFTQPVRQIYREIEEIVGRAKPK
ncbi:hypothetical protein LCGC14_0231900 [marine sediment metagenome]|uniref:Uncharacterized protein n=1 Tax=marine sediment metagenome TaxID=412755 RepID=A0A0F9URE7_9ZZZZ